MKISCVTHADFESPGVIEHWAQENDYDFSIIKPYRGEACPHIGDFDCLIVMGGPQSPIQLEAFPYLADEIELIRQAIQANKYVLGFCLGAQLIGEALGAKTEKSPEKEIGVFPITLTAAGKDDPLFEGFSHSFAVIHWHNDMPGETDDSALLAFSAGCPRQVLRYAPKVYGFQCHLEITKEGIETMINACPDDLTVSKFTQTKNQLLEQNYTEVNQFMRLILDRFVSGFSKRIGLRSIDGTCKAV